MFSFSVFLNGINLRINSSAAKTQRRKVLIKLDVPILSE